MQEFLLNNTVNCNLMSLTGYRTLVILDLLMEAPRSAAEINEYFLNNQYIKEKFSVDTLRIYINSLRAIGCEITKANKTTNNKFELLSHPFTFDISKSQLKALSKLYMNIHDKVEVSDVVTMDNFFAKILSHINDDNTKDFLSNISVLKTVNKLVLKDLMLHCKNKNQIIFLYKSPASAVKEIEIIADKLAFKSEKLYLWGTSITHGGYAYFRADKIAEILAIKMRKDENNIKPTKVVYEIYNQRGSYILSQNERIIEETSEKIVVEAMSQNKFELIQKILYQAQDCKIISPVEWKEELTLKLKAMKENYL